MLSFSTTALPKRTVCSAQAVISLCLSLSRYMSGFPPLVPPPLIMCQPTISLMERGTCNQAGQADLTHRESGTRQSANTQLSRPHAPKGAGDR